MLRYKFYRITTLFILVLSISLLSSCYETQVTKRNEYTEIRSKMQIKDSSIYEFLPEIVNNDDVKDMYFYYSDKDFLDTMYAIYLNCVFSKEKYATEQQRLTELYNEADVIADPGIFDCKSIIIEMQTEANNSTLTYLRYTYVLFYENESRIVYVKVFEKGDHFEWKNIPSEYMPRKTGDGSLCSD